MGGVKEGGDRVVRLAVRDVGAMGPVSRAGGSVPSIALLEAVPLPFPWLALEAFAPEALVFASRNAVEVFVRALAMSPSRGRAPASRPPRGRASGPDEAPGREEGPSPGGPRPHGTAFPDPWDWRAARLAAVGESTARALRMRLAEEGHGEVDVLTPAGGAVGLEATLEALGAARVAALGAREGRAHSAGGASPAGGLLPVDCYVLVPSPDGAEEVRAAARSGPVGFDVGSASLAAALIDALAEGGLLPPVPGLEFLPRHASARSALLAALPGHEASIRALPPAR